MDDITKFWPPINTLANGTQFIEDIPILEEPE
jgi:hypothetical protein